MAEATPVNIMGAGLSGLAAATILAKAGVEVHVHDIREESGARFDGDFQALENWSMENKCDYCRVNRNFSYYKSF